MTNKEKCDLIEATLQRLLNLTSDASGKFVVSRQCCPKFYLRECVVIESTNGVFSAYWVAEFYKYYVFFFYDDKIWIQSVRNLPFICSVL